MRPQARCPDDDRPTWAQVPLGPLLLTLPDCQHNTCLCRADSLGPRSMNGLRCEQSKDQLCRIRRILVNSGRANDTTRSVISQEQSAYLAAIANPLCGNVEAIGIEMGNDGLAHAGQAYVNFCSLAMGLSRDLP